MANMLPPPAPRVRCSGNGTGNIYVWPSISDPLNRVRLVIDQQPKTGKACSVNDKSCDRKPLDPPPILHMEIVGPSSAAREDQILLSSPNIFCVARLKAVNETDEAREKLGIKDPAKRLWGGACTSGRRLRDMDGWPLNYLIWPELMVKEKGMYRLCFELYYITSARGATLITDVTCDTFEGLKLRTREENKKPAKRRKMAQSIETDNSRGSSVALSGATQGGDTAEQGTATASPHIAAAEPVLELPVVEPRSTTTVENTRLPAPIFALNPVDAANDFDASIPARPSSNHQPQGPPTQPQASPFGATQAMALPVQEPHQGIATEQMFGFDTFNTSSVTSVANYPQVNQNDSLSQAAYQEPLLNHGVHLAVPVYYGSHMQQGGHGNNYMVNNNPMLGSLPFDSVGFQSQGSSLPPGTVAPASYLHNEFAGTPVLDDWTTPSATPPTANTSVSKYDMSGQDDGTGLPPIPPSCVADVPGTTEGEASIFDTNDLGDYGFDFNFAFM
ncbi:velvet factor-domain-containing protein [Microdochium trichocladiopsis]|uniref:Velvet factor-domain-containing protein n=1 Tax=Microdochium trichocladiopsis TaxID=1682393 RepID=A0A9P8Y530_9PEZI|nr:velvet factor-domain-containing protein [Microdochium trichocladiopsis]KAH7028092.1 velvet factor-domain-containing protein [Microdochium trichocladiopsis]